ncbi:MAG: tRNA dihydrouridine synthase DusB [Bacilli bacterium]
MFKIGEIEIKNKLVLAPMAGICDNAFRTIAKDFGVGLVCTEMVSEKAIYYKNERTLKMLYVSEEERPVSLQVFGSDVETFTSAIEYINEHSLCDIIDINMGCPVPKVATKSGSGAGLMKNPKLVREIVTAAVAISKKPITVKIRTGWDDSSINCVEIAKIIEECGASAIAIHGRTRKQMYTGLADLDLIKQVKKSVKIPIIGNGDIIDIESAKRMLATGVDAIMIGRGCLGNPFLFEEVLCFLENRNYTKPTPREKLTVALEHLNRLIELKGEKVAISEMRTHMHCYLKGLPNSSVVKSAVNKTKSKKDYENLIFNYLQSI